MENYICDCGKTFDKAASFNGHKSHCKQHMIAKYGNLDYYNEFVAKTTQKCTQTKHENYKQKLKTSDDTWLAEQHICEKCGQVMVKKFGSGRFCSRACANSRVFSEETNLKRQKSNSNKRPYYNSDGIVKYFDNDAIIPKGWYYGNLSIVKDKEYWLSSTQSVVRIPQRTTGKSSGLKRADIAKLTAIYKTELIEKQKLINAKVLQDYLLFLRSKINGRTYTVPENVFMYGKYLSIASVDHPRAIYHKNGRVHIHILAAEELLGRHLSQDEVVHHINENKLDNNFDNLIIFDSLASYARFHNNAIHILRIDNDRLVCEKFVYPKFNYQDFLLTHPDFA